jgi:hypothetical protein
LSSKPYVNFERLPVALLAALDALAALDHDTLKRNVDVRLQCGEYSDEVNELWFITQRSPYLADALPCARIWFTACGVLFADRIDAARALLAFHAQRIATQADGLPDEDLDAIGQFVMDVMPALSQEATSQPYGAWVDAHELCKPYYELMHTSEWSSDDPTIDSNRLASINHIRLEAIQIASTWLLEHPRERELLQIGESRESISKGHNDL